MHVVLIFLFVIVTYPFVFIIGNLFKLLGWDEQEEAQN